MEASLARIIDVEDELKDFKLKMGLALKPKGPQLT